MSARSAVRGRVQPVIADLRLRWDDADVRQARLVAQRVRSDPPTVVHFGASESIYIAPADEDRRALPEMVKAGLTSPASFHSVIGAGYQPDLFEAYLRFLRPLARRPVIVVGIPVRVGFSQWWEHPRYGYRRAVATVNQLSATQPLLMRRRPRRPNEEELRRYDAAPLRSFLGTFPRGHYRAQLRDQRTSDAGAADPEALRFAYFWGGVDDVTGDWLDCVTHFARRLRTDGYDVVPYHQPLPLEQGSAIWDGFRDYVLANVELLETAFCRGYGDVDFVRTGWDMDATEFIDPADASEHVNERGRQRLATSMAQRIELIEASRN